MKEFLHMRGPLAEKQLFIFDMDGTLYLGEKVFEPAPRGQEGAFLYEQCLT